MTVAVASAVIVGPSAVGAEASGPHLRTPVSELRAAVWCDSSVGRDTGKEAVLLVHGTGGSPADYWSWNWERALPAAGFGVCTVALPHRAVINLTISAEYVVYAARYAYRESGRKIAIVGHSQGGTLAVWATKFWPDVAADTADVVSLSGDFGGTAVGNVDCVVRLCPALAWQAAIGSHVMHAVRSAPQPNGVSYTSVFSLTDEVVTPSPLASTLPGAMNIPVQSICPLRISDHITMVIDSLSWALALDAIRHAGPASPARLAHRARLCLDSFMPDVDWLAAPRTLRVAGAFTDALLGGQPWVRAEPPLPAYAARYG